MHPLAQQETKSSTKQLAPTDPILGLKTGFAQKGLPSILLFFNRMILNSGRHTQPDPQSCRVRSLGGRRGEPKNKQHIKRPKQNWAVRRPIVIKRSTANANTEKSIPLAMSQRNQHLTHAMFVKTLHRSVVPSKPKQNLSRSKLPKGFSTNVSQTLVLSRSNRSRQQAMLQHTLSFSRSGLSQRMSLGVQFKYCSKVTKTKEWFLCKLQTGFQSWRNS